MLQKNLVMAKLRTECFNTDVKRGDIIKHPWMITKDTYIMRNTGPHFIIESSDNSIAITKILVGPYTIAVQFRDLQKHKELIANSKLSCVTLPDDLFMSLDDESEANALFVSWKFHQSNFADKAKNVANLINLLTLIEKDAVMSALCCLCHYLNEEKDYFVNEVLAFSEVIELLNKEAYAHTAEIKYTQESRWYLITELMNRASNVDIEQKFELFLIVADFCSDIPSSDPHFKEANQRLLELSFNFDPSENAEQKIHRLETRLRCALRAEDQKLIDLSFHELCLEPDVTAKLLNIQGDEDTLIMLAAHIREKNALIMQLNTKPIQVAEPARFNFNAGFK